MDECSRGSGSLSCSICAAAVRPVGAALTATLLGMAVNAAPGLSLNLPLQTPPVTVKVPRVAVKAPSVPPPVNLKAPPIPVKAPPVEVEVPPVPVKPPPIPVKAPPVPIRPAPVTVKTPSLPVKTPTAPIKAPTIKAATGPSGTAQAPRVPVSTPNVSARAPGVSVRPPSAAGAVSSSRNAAAVTVTSDRASGANPSTPAGRIAARERKLKATVARERSCLGSLPEPQEQLLEMRTGLGRVGPLSPRKAAARMHVATARFARLEAQALRELGSLSAHGCERTGVVVAAVTVFAGRSVGTPTASSGVEAARYSARPAAPQPPLASGGGPGLLATKLAPAASALILALVLLLGAALTATAIAADASGHGPRHAHWRRHMRNRIRNRSNWR